MFKIDKNIPVPHGIRGKHTGLMEVLRQMEIGDSVFIEGVNVKQLGGMGASRMKREGKRLVKRTVEGGTRIWRIE